METDSTQTQVSAGGVAFRSLDHSIQVMLISVGDPPRWQLPKGKVDPGETTKSTSLREVREEAGIETEMIEPIDKISYWFYTTSQGKRVRVRKLVYFFLLKYISGDPQDHDWEVNEARWVEIDQAIEMLTFDSEKEVVRRAKALIQNHTSAL